MAKGLAYLTVILDWYSRKALCWGVSNTMDNSFCLEARKEAIARDGRPEIFNTDPGRQLTSDALTGKLKEGNIRIRMDGKGRWRGNVFL
jgi:putative transposase